MGVVIIKDNEKFFSRVMKGEGKLYIYGVGNLCKLLLSGDMDSLNITSYKWKDKIAGFLDRNAKDRLSFIKDFFFLPPPIYTLEEFCVQELNQNILVLLCVGIGKKHIRSYANIIQALEKCNVKIELLTIYDALKNSSYYREDTGMVEAPGLYKIIDQARYIESSPWYFNQLYDKSDYFTYETGKKMIKTLNECSCIITDKNQIALRNTTGEYFNVINGRRITYSENETYQKRIHFFGDSRVLGIYVDDLETISSLLQKQLDCNQSTSYRVFNYGIVTFSIERILHQIKYASYKKGDIIIIAGGINMQLCKDKIALWNAFMELVATFCEKQGLHLILLHMPSIYELKENTCVEKHILEVYNWILFPYNYESGVIWEKFGRWCSNMNVSLLDMTQMQQKRYKYGEIFIDVVHYSPNGHLWIANELCKNIQEIEQLEPVQFIEDTFFSSDAKDILLKKREAFFNNLEKHEQDIVNIQTQQLIEDYLNQHKEIISDIRDGDKVGCIVMNCNPFTLGHKYLIEQASNQVTKLFIFVVEENKSFFDIQDRLALVKQGCEEFKNVIVLPSGMFMISALTFPEYFMKEELKQTRINPTVDLLLFCKYIAPFFKISVRFVGEEPFDAITRQYNKAMKDILEEYEIDVCIIKRKEIENQIISASLVRNYLEKRNFHEIKKLVPDTTYQYLLTRFSSLT